MKERKKLPNIKVNYLYTLGFQILQIIVPFITTPYVSRVLGAENIGIYSFVNAMFLYFQLIAILGIGTYAQIESAKLRDNKEKMSQFFSEIMIIRWITTGISAILYYIFITSQDEYRQLYIIEYIALLGYAIDVTWLYEGVENFRYIVIKNVAVRLLSVICIFLFVRHDNDIAIYLLINVSGNFIGNISVIPYIKNYVSLKNLKRLCLKRHFQKILVYFLPTIASTILLTMDKIMLGFLTGDKAQNGYYEQAIKIYTIIFSIFSAFYHTMKSRISYLISNNEEDRIEELMTKTFNFIVFLSVPLSFGIFIVSDFFVDWFLGIEYHFVSELLKIMSPWLLIKTMSNCFLDQYLTPTGHQKTVNIIIWAGAAINLILNYIFIRRYMANGAAIATLLSEFIILIMSWFSCKNVLKISQWIYVSKKYFISGVCMLIVLKVISTRLKSNIISTIALVLFGSGIYLGGLIIMKDYFLLEQINIFSNKFKKLYKD